MMKMMVMIIMIIVMMMMMMMIKNSYSKTKIRNKIMTKIINLPGAKFIKISKRGKQNKTKKNTMSSLLSQQPNQTEIVKNFFALFVFKNVSFFIIIFKRNF